MLAQPPTPGVEFPLLPDLAIVMMIAGAVKAAQLPGLVMLTVGALLTGCTVRTKLSLAVAAPSETLTVIVVVPFRFNEDRAIRLRLAPVPARRRLLFETNN